MAGFVHIWLVKDLNIIAQKRVMLRQFILIK